MGENATDWWLTGGAIVAVLCGALVATETLRRALWRHRSAQWFNTYVQSPAWRDKRRQVLERDCYICQVCGAGGAWHMCHQTYERVGHEALDDLIAVCQACHQAVQRQYR